MKPERIQRKRVAGWKMPPNTVYVGRGSKWGNPFVIGSQIISSRGDRTMSPEEAVETFRLWVTRIDTPEEREAIEGFGICTFDLTDIAKELRGKNLACWCPPGAPCHADVLLQLANEQVSA